MMTTRSFHIATLALLLALATPTQAQEVQQVSVPLTDPGKPVVLEAGLLSGGIQVEGHAGGEVLIEVVAGEMDEDDGDDRRRGMRRIPNTSMGLTVEEENNVVEVRGNWASRISELRIKVPRRTSMQVSCTNNGDITVRNIEGELELKNTNGEITALDVSGSVVAHTTNGDVRVTFSDIASGKAMSFVTFNGDVDVTFPPSLKADLRLNAGQGEIYTDFEFQLTTEKPKIESGRDGGRYRVDLEREVAASIGGGGPEMHFKTWSGDIFIRSE